MLCSIWIIKRMNSFQKRFCILHRPDRGQKLNIIMDPWFYSQSLPAQPGSPEECCLTGSCPSRTPSHTWHRGVWLHPSPGQSVDDRFRHGSLYSRHAAESWEMWGGFTWKALTMVRWSLLEFLDRVLLLMSAIFSLPWERDERNTEAENSTFRLEGFLTEWDDWDVFHRHSWWELV